MNKYEVWRQVMKFGFGPQPRYLGPDADPGTPPPPPPAPKDDVQAKIDAAVQKRLGEQQKKFDTQRAGDLERMKALETDAAKAATLQTEIDELNTRYKSKDELAQDAFKKTQAENAAALKKAQDEGSGWKKRFEEQSLMVQLGAAAAKKSKGADGKDIELTNPNQFVSFLKPNTRLVEKVAEGKGTGEYEARIKFSVKGKELDVTPDEAIKAASEDPDYLHWFKSGVVGGLGTSGGRQGGGTDGLLTMPQEKFTELFLQGKLPKRK